MRSRVALLFAAFVVVLLVGAGAVYAVDRSQSGKIAEGISIDGIDVGGMTGTEASAALRSRVAPLSETVVVKAGGKRFTLPPQRAQVQVDVDDSVRTALARSREGNVLARAWRSVRGGEVDEDLDLSISYSEVSIDRLVDRVAGKIDEEAVDASVDLESGDITPQASRDGRALKKAKLRHDVQRTLLALGDDKTVRGRTQVVKPKVTTAEFEYCLPEVV